MPKPFKIIDWYWIVGSDTTRVYSSKAKNYVPITDTTYLAWKADNTMPSKIDTPFNLGGVLGDVNLSQLKPLDATVLDGYADIQADQIVIHAAFKVLFNHENRLRACERALSLNGSPPDLTPAQAKAAVKQLMM